jgi:predicted ATP-binding protein involved in virulence
MKIKSIYLKNFRNVIEGSYELDPHFTVFIGINGKGKSTWLHALRILCGSYLLSIPEVKKRHIHEDEIRRTEGKITSFQTPVIVQAKGYFQEYGDELVTWQRRITEKLTKTTSTTEDVGKVRDLGAKKYKELTNENFPSDALNLPIIAFFGTSRAHGGGRNRDKNRHQKLIFKYGYDNWYELRSTTYQYDTWLSTFEVLAKEGKEYAEGKKVFFETIKKSNPEYIKEVDFINDQLWLKVKIGEYESQMLPIDLHSDGIKTFTEMVAEIAYRCIMLNGYKKEKAVEETSGVVMIDELDLHLHPNWQKHVVKDLKNAFPNIQFVATTHSPFIVQSLNNHELVNLDENEGVFGALNMSSLEEVAEYEMGVENPQRSKAFLERLEVAEKYFSLIKNGVHEKSKDRLNELKKELDKYEEMFNQDPAYVALLKIERKSKGL